MTFTADADDKMNFCVPLLCLFSGSVGAAAADAFGQREGVAAPLTDDALSARRSRYSSAHCIGQTFQADEWKGSSCYFRNLCYDYGRGRFVFSFDCIW